MKTRTTRRILGVGLAAALAADLAGCVAVTSRDQLPPELQHQASAAEASAPLGGEALSQRKMDMQRAYRDMVHFDKTLTSLNRRRDRKGRVLFRNFLDRYMGIHLEPMLMGEWQSRHPELTALDVNLRLAKAELLIQLRERGRAQSVIDEIAHRYEGREDMLVGYPLGGQSRLGDALEAIESRKWSG
jgi:hypothetical protein